MVGFVYTTEKVKYVLWLPVSGETIGTVSVNVETVSWMAEDDIDGFSSTSMPIFEVVPSMRKPLLIAGINIDFIDPGREGIVANDDAMK